MNYISIVLDAVCFWQVISGVWGNGGSLPDHQGCLGAGRMWRWTSLELAQRTVKGRQAHAAARSHPVVVCCCLLVGTPQEVAIGGSSEARLVADSPLRCTCSDC